jgi:type VI secretion system ImpH/TssG family protein
MSSFIPTDIHRYSFHTLIRHLESQGIGLENIDWQGDLSLSFPASDIASFTEKKGKIVLTFTLLNLLGSYSPLPHYFLDMSLKDAIAGQRLTGLLQLLNKPLLTLSYQTFKQYHPFIGLEKNKEHYLQKLRNLSGVFFHPKNDKLFSFSAYLNPRSRNKGNLTKALSHLFFPYPIDVKDFVLQWQSVPILKIGADKITLSDNSVLGNRLPHFQKKVQIIVGPIPSNTALFLWRDKILFSELITFTKAYLPATQEAEFLLKITAENEPYRRIGKDPLLFGEFFWLGKPHDGHYEIRLPIARFG